MPTQAHPEEAPATADHISRRLWRALEPYHAVVYFMPDTRRRTDALGLKGGWMSYFGTRAAPLGPVPAEVVAALFYNFHPDMVRRAIPDAWSHASPEALVEARLAAVDEGLRRLLGPAVDGGAIGEAAELAAAAALATASAAGGPPAEMLRAYRKWSQGEWDEAVERLRSRGWLDGRGALTGAGRAGRDGV